MLENLSTIEKIDAASGILDQLIESKGREKCAQICVLGDLLDHLRKDVLVMSEQLKDLKSQTPDPEIKLELVPDQNEEGENG